MDRGAWTSARFLALAAALALLPAAAATLTFAPRETFAGLAAPTAPEQPTLGTIEPSRVTIAWPAVANASAYACYRIVGGSYARVGGALAQPACVDEGLTPGVRYTWFVTAWNAAGESLPSPYVRVTLPLTAIPARPEPPTTVVAEADGALASVRVSWSSVALATSYRVYRSSSAEGVFALVSPSPWMLETFVDDGLGWNETHWYRVSALGAEGESLLSAAAGARTPPAPIPPIEEPPVGTPDAQASPPHAVPQDPDAEVATDPSGSPAVASAQEERTSPAGGIGGASSLVWQLAGLAAVVGLGVAGHFVARSRR